MISPILMTIIIAVTLTAVATVITLWYISIYDKCKEYAIYVNTFDNIPQAEVYEDCMDRELWK